MGPKLAVGGLLLGGAALAAAVLWPAERPPEVAVRELHLSGPLAQDDAEISGLGWLGDELVVLPQYPGRLVSKEGETLQGVGSLFAMSRESLTHAIDGAPMEPPRTIRFDMGHIPELDGYDGFESIAFSGDQVFVTVEVERETETFGLLARGRVSEDRSQITLEPNWVKLRAQSDLSDLAYEAILIHDGRVVAFFEAACGAEQPPVAYTFDFDLQPKGQFPVDLQFRLTDATQADVSGRFWVSNYYWGGDEWEAGSCPLQQRFGEGASHCASSNVERLVELRMTGDGIEVAGSPPLQLELHRDPRNWEGIARFGDRGLIIATDEHPRSMLAFVAFPKPKQAP